jgi:hypothetical protein
MPRGRSLAVLLFTATLLGLTLGMQLQSGAEGPTPGLRQVVELLSRKPLAACRLEIAAE